MLLSIRIFRQKLLEVFADVGISYLVSKGAL
jgi:hypothetical protein